MASLKSSGPADWSHAELVNRGFLYQEKAHPRTSELSVLSIISYLDPRSRPPASPSLPAAHGLYHSHRGLLNMKSQRGCTVFPAIASSFTALITSCCNGLCTYLPPHWLRRLTKKGCVCVFLGPRTWFTADAQQTWRKRRKREGRKMGWKRRKKK